MKKSTIVLSALTSLLFLSNCNREDAQTPRDLQVNITGLENLGTTAKYEGWLLVNGAPVSTGTFTVNDAGKMSVNSFAVDQNVLDNATKFILTIEPFPDSNTAPTDTHILAGNFSGSSADLSISAPEALGNNFSTAKGNYVLATPSDGDGNNENSGLWFINLPPSAGLTLPILPAGWKYEGWAVINGNPISTGTFTDPAKADAFSGFSGTLGTPPFPGEDFLKNAPNGFTFPVNLANGKAVISIEPYPDNSPKPFLLKPLVGDIPANATDHTVYSLTNMSTSNNPTGNARR